MQSSHGRREEDALEEMEEATMTRAQGVRGRSWDMGLEGEAALISCSQGLQAGEIPQLLCL